MKLILVKMHVGLSVGYISLSLAFDEVLQLKPLFTPNGDLLSEIFIGSHCFKEKRRF